MKLSKIKLNPAKFGLDLGDGSERAEYVNQDYILHTLGRPHRFISIMYTYYPKNKEWPQRIRIHSNDPGVERPYDDYFPYEGGLGKDTTGQPFEQMRDIRRHGQDVALTLTIDCSLTDDYLRAIAKDLVPFGRMRIRINHECTGDWFTHNRRHSYAEVGAFYARFGRIIKEEAPNVSLVFCGPWIDYEKTPNILKYEEEFTDAVNVADVWSLDRYLALHYGWPFDICEKGGTTYMVSPLDELVKLLHDTVDRANVVNTGAPKKICMAENNVDGDVTGAMRQGKPFKKLLELLKENGEGWFDGISMYQFRDRGRLGLEIEDPNNNTVGIPQPILEDYKEILRDPAFIPSVSNEGEAELPVTLRWGGSEDAEGLAVEVNLEKNPEFFELYFEEELNLMIEVNGKWFYKSPKNNFVDLMPAFFKEATFTNKSFTVKFFAPPATGENDLSQGTDWQTNYYTTINKLPNFRIRYEVIGEPM